MSETEKKTVAVLFGGRSAEHEISVITGLEVVEALDTSRYNVMPVYIDMYGRWWAGEALRSKEFYKSLPDSFSKVRQVALMPTPGIGGLVVRGDDKGSLKKLLTLGANEIISVDVYMPIFHGQLGEDGCIQGLFEMADVAYTGAGVLASSVAMSKPACKALVSAHGIPVLPGVVLYKDQVQQNLAAAREKIENAEGMGSYPYFVKPVNLGSSVAVGKADTKAELDGALAKVFQHDFQALVEPCITNLLEVNVSVIETAEGPRASVTEVPVASDGVLTYEDKYMRGGGGKKGGSKGKASGQRISGMAGLTRVIDPEDLDASIKDRVRKYAVQAYQAMECGGCVRFDFMIDSDTDSLYFNELNPIPGSMAFYLWEKTKPPVLYPEICNHLIEAALRRRQERAGLARDMGFKAMFA